MSFKVIGLGDVVLGWQKGKGTIILFLKGHKRRELIDLVLSCLKVVVCSAVTYRTSFLFHSSLEAWNITNDLFYIVKYEVMRLSQIIKPIEKLVIEFYSISRMPNSYINCFWFPGVYLIANIYKCCSFIISILHGLVTLIVNLIILYVCVCQNSVA